MKILLLSNTVATELGLIYWPKSTNQVAPNGAFDPPLCWSAFQQRHQSSAFAAND